ncbi:hypothetical protein G3I32_38900 [Streptomyces coelicoflavus]|uniref:Uncharacterized protein n=1 Tax=Streptomyces coelicoflavus TaxID=285562 RepID=A0A7K3PZJ6_9ACTN|nr:hypothetical protein [Streptomyces coelicoflavus]NEB14731.1 hypothetical protein [Streptomyces coelicoflavus]
MAVRMPVRMPVRIVVLVLVVPVRMVGDARVVVGRSLRDTEPGSWDMAAPARLRATGELRADR